MQKQIKNINYKIIIRARLKEQSIQNELFGHLLIKDKIELCTLDNLLYKRLSQSDIVIGAQSTILFEALIYKCRVWFTPNIHLKECELFEEINEHTNFNELLDKKPKDIDINHIWQSNWKQNYKKFLSRYDIEMDNI